jgi:hypothetical protein
VPALLLIDDIDARSARTCAIVCAKNPTAIQLDLLTGGTQMLLDKSGFNRG